MRDTVNGRVYFTLLYLLKMLLPPELRPGPRWGAYSAPQTNSWIWRAASAGMGTGKEGVSDALTPSNLTRGK